MCLFSLAKIERELEREVQSPVAEARFLEYVARLPPEMAAGLARWSDVREFLRALGVKTEAADPALRPLIQMLQAADGGESAGIALYIFWYPIAATCRRFWRLDDPDRLFSQASWDLLRAIHRIDLNCRMSRIGMKIVNDVTHGVRAWYRREQKRFPALIVQEDEPDPSEELHSHYGEHLIAERLIDRAWTVARLRALAEAGSISRADFQILLGCYVYGRPLEEMARHLGVEYQAAKKRRQRAVKKLEKSSPDLSPSSADSPLCPVGRSARREADDER